MGLMIDRSGRRVVGLGSLASCGIRHVWLVGFSWRTSLSRNGLIALVEKR